jgi:hypothetical protein
VMAILRAGGKSPNRQLMSNKDTSEYARQLLTWAGIFLEEDEAPVA